VGQTKTRCRYRAAGLALSRRKRSTFQRFAKIFMAQEEHMRTAINAADAARAGWAVTPPAERERLLRRAADELVAVTAEIADLLVDEAGSTVGKAHMEIAITADDLRSIAGEARRILGSGRGHHIRVGFRKSRHCARPLRSPGNCGVSRNCDTERCPEVWDSRRSLLSAFRFRARCGQSSRATSRRPGSWI
jgi:acyl-CoA reductase-like NAD-dependent aldehyde dehydrogenase